jgi:hypothetical protein
VNKVSPITRAFKNKSLAPLRYLADKMTLTKIAVSTISDHKAYNIPLYKVGVLAFGLSVAIPGTS